MPDLTRRHILIGLYAMQAWERGGKDPSGEPYAASWFDSNTAGFHTGIGRDDRKNLLRLIRRWRCLVCHEFLEDNSDGDHMIPLAAGGAWGVANFLPLCQPHNSSKGKKDFAEWWQKKEYPLEPLLPDALTVYCRNSWQMLGPAVLTATAPPLLIGLLDRFAARLPSDSHREALVRAYTKVWL